MFWEISLASLKHLLFVVEVESFLLQSFGLDLRELFCSALLETYLSMSFIALEKARNA